jgi:hypothetical protein
MAGLLVLTFIVHTNFGQTRVTVLPNPLSIPVAVFDYAQIPPQWLSQAQGEMTRIYREIGIDIRWQNPRLASDQSESPVDGSRADPTILPRETLIIVVRSNSASTETNFPQNVVGTASGTADERGRVAYVFYDRMDQFRMEQSPSIYRAKLLGHLMAHEVGHLLLPIQAHSSRGLMRAHWDRDDLELAQEGRLRFTDEQANLIRSKLSRRAEPAIDMQGR